VALLDSASCALTAVHSDANLRFVGPPPNTGRVVAGRVSVIVPCFNAEAFVGEAIDSALAQTHRDVEIIVVDDGSSDRSRDIVRRYGARVMLLEQDNRGPYPARNAGLRAAAGEFVAFLDADDYWRPTCLATLHRALEQTGADLAYCGWQNVGPGRPASGGFIPPRYEDGDPVAAFLRSCPWPIHAALTRRHVIDAVGGFSERRFSSMDYDLWIRLLAVTRRFVGVPEVLAFYRWHDQGQISAVKWRQTLDAWHVRRDFVGANPGLVAHLDAAKLRELTDGPLLKAAYQAYWRRDFEAAHRLFRMSLRRRLGHARDLKHLLLSLLPRRLYCALVAAADRSTAKAPTT
jgi:glycosyltransferase involved in cell wall biosynthesis